jgi:hypothetical protein
MCGLRSSLYNRRVIELEVDQLTEQQAKLALNEIINKLDLLDCGDYFGTEGWRKFLNIKSLIPSKI